MQQCNNATDITKHEGNTIKLIQQWNIAATLLCNSSTEIKKQGKYNEAALQYCNNATLQQCYRGYLEKQKIHDEGN